MANEQDFIPQQNIVEQTETELKGIMAENQFEMKLINELYQGALLPVAVDDDLVYQINGHTSFVEIGAMERPDVAKELVNLAKKKGISLDEFGKSIDMGQEGLQLYSKYGLTVVPTHANLALSLSEIKSMIPKIETEMKKNPTRESISIERFTHYPKGLMSLTPEMRKQYIVYFAAVSCAAALDNLTSEKVISNYYYSYRAKDLASSLV